MMRYLFCISLLVFLAFGLTKTTHEGLSGVRMFSVNPTGTFISSAEPECTFETPSAEPSSSRTHRSLYNDGSVGRWTSDVLLLSISYAQNNAPSKLLKIKIIPPVNQIMRLLSVRLSADQRPNLAFTPNAIRYSNGYYVYELACILI